MKSRLIDHISSQELNETHIRTDYSIYAMNQVSRILKNGINDQAITRKEVEAITIDGATSLDLDDAIWGERTRDGYCVWIHISDVSEAVPIFSPLDIEALRRTTSVYRRDHILDMFPPELSNNTFSLDPYGAKKLTLTLQIDIDNEWKVKNHSFYESRFSNMKRYDYENFWEDFTNPDCENFSTLQLLKEISDKLRRQRLLNWWIVGWQDDDRRISLWWWNRNKTRDDSATTHISHDIIESFMVLANVSIGQHLVDAGVPTILKRHDSLDERSYYHHSPGSFHAGLWMTNYTHFTSPIRRYIDLVIHRTMKALQRWEELPYTIEDNKFIAKHSNNTRWKIETLGAQIDIETRWQEFMKRAEKRLWRPLEVYDMKPYIRNTVHRSMKLPKVMKESIANLIMKGNTSFWTWALGIMLLGKDNDLKHLMKKRILEDRVLSPRWFLSILTQTQILLWEGTIFELDEHEESWNYSTKITCRWVVVARAKWILKNHKNMEDLRYACRRELIENLFEYFINN